MLGGGMTITYGSRGDWARAVNTPRSRQRWYNGRSTACGSYWGGSSKRGGGIPYIRQVGGGRWGLVEVGGRIRSHARRRPGAPHEAARPQGRDHGGVRARRLALLPRRDPHRGLNPS